MLHRFCYFSLSLSRSCRRCDMSTGRDVRRGTSTRRNNIHRRGSRRRTVRRPRRRRRRTRWHAASYGRHLRHARFVIRPHNTASGAAGMNLKVGGGTGPERKWRGTNPNFLGRFPPLFGSKNTISRFGERFSDGQYSLVSFLFAVLLRTVPPVPSHL